MNYVILNDEDYFTNKINLQNFKEVSRHGRDRCDGVFGTITRELLEECYRDEGRRDKFFEEAGLYGNWGLEFIVFKIPQDLLYFDNTELIPLCFRFINANDFFTQIWSFSYKNTWEYFLIGIKKSHGLNYIFDTKIDSYDNAYGLEKICKKIEESLF